MPHPSSIPPVVLQVIPRLIAGGVERGCVDIALALKQAGGMSLVASQGGSMARELERAGIRHLTLPLASKNPFIIWRNIRRLEKIIRHYNVQIIHARSRAPAWSAYYAAKHTGIKFITTFHGPYNFKNNLKRFYNAIMARGERIIAVSQFIQDRIQQAYGVDPSRIRLIHRGIDTESFTPEKVPLSRIIQLGKEWHVPEDALIVMLPGRLTRWKGQEVLIDAIHKLNRPDVFCVLVGSTQGKKDHYRQELIQKIHLLDLSGKVRVVDHCDDMPAAYMLAHVVVSASTKPEAFGRVIVEAQAMGCPVIVTDIGAVQDTVIPGETAYVVPPGDSEALAEALGKALALSPEQRTTMAVKARTHVQKVFTKTKMCADTLAVYRELTSTSEVPGRTT